MDSFVLVAYASLAASRTILQRLLACLNFTLKSEDLFCWNKLKKWFLWIKAAAQAAENKGDNWGLTWYLRWGIYTSTNYIHLNALLKLASSSRSMERLSNDHEGRPSQHENSHRLWYETGLPVLSLLESQWKLKQQHNLNFPLESRSRTNTSVRRNK